MIAVSLLVFGRAGLVTRSALALHDELNLNAGGNALTALVARLLQYIGLYRHLTALALGLSAYAVLEGIEGLGLARRLRWAEYLTVLATGVLIPYELIEVVRHVTVFKVAALLLNAAIVGYLTYRKRLFIDI